MRIIINNFKLLFFSLLDSVSESINIYVIYKKGFNRKSISEKINQHNKLNNISFIEFNSDVDEFPNVKDSHVSEDALLSFIFRSTYRR